MPHGTTSSPPAGTDSAGSAAPALLPALAQLPGHLLWRAAARVYQALDEVLPPGSDVHAYAALIALGEGRTLSQQELADRIGVSRTTMVRVAATLTEAGLVERVRNPDDRRSYALTRTVPGARSADDWERHAGALEDRLVGGFSPTEVVELRTLMERLAADDLHELTPPGLRASIGFLLTQVHARTHRDFALHLAPLGIAPRDFGTLTGLRATGAVSQSELARMLGVSGATVVQIVDDLEQPGLVERQRDPADRRTHLVHLTDAGRRTLARAHRGLADQQHPVLSELEEPEQVRLVELLGRFITAP